MIKITKHQKIVDDVAREVKLIHGDCLEEMKNMPDRSVDCVLTDTCIPFEPMWKQLKRVIKKNGAKNSGSKIMLINGNCLEELPKIQKMLEKFVIVTDPPFNIGYHYNSYDDSLEQDEYYQMLQEVFSYGPFVCIHYPEELYKIAFQVGEFPEKVVSWVYNSNTAKQHRDIAFFGIKPDFKKYGQEYKNPTDKRIAKRIANGQKARLYDWWEINQVKNVSKDKTEHPCQMPVEVMQRIIGILPEDYTIVDPFMGSGTTGVACKKLNRKFIGIEIDESYYRIAKERITLTLPEARELLEALKEKLK